LQIKPSTSVDKVCGYTRLGTFEDAIHIGGRAPKHVRQARPIGHQAPSLHGVSPAVHGGQLVLERERDDVAVLTVEQQRVRQDEKRASALPVHGCEGTLELLRTAHL
jgi:hypothetical protein